MMKYIVLALLLFAPTVFAQAFGNNIMQLPSVGFLQVQSFGVDNQVAIGAEYSGAIGYQTWWFAETAVGFGKAGDPGEKRTIASAHGALGVRYYFTNQIFRPFISGSLNYLQFIGKAQTLWFEHNYTPIWIGLKPAAGLEWQFAQEMSVQLEASYGIFVNFSDPFKHTFAGKLSYNLYF